MAQLSEQHQLRAIHGEIIARDLYAKLGEKIDSSDGKTVMLRLSAEEETHRVALAARYRSIHGKEYEYDADLSAGRDYSFLKDSVFGYTQAMEALKLALGAEVDAANMYSQFLNDATERDDIRMLRDLVKFEKQHQKKLRREITKIEKSNH